MVRPSSRSAIDCLLISELDHSLVPSITLVIDVITLTIYATAFVILVGQVELGACNIEMTHYLIGSAVIFLEGFDPLLVFSVLLTCFGFVEVPPLVLDHRRDPVIERELHAVHMVQVVETNIEVMMIIFQDY